MNDFIRRIHRLRKSFPGYIGTLWGEWKRKWKLPFEPLSKLLISPLAKLATGRGCTQPENSEIHSKSQKVKKFHFSQKVALFDFSGKNSKSRTFRKKLHFSTFRAIFALFDFSGKNSKSRTFRKKLHFSTFRAVFSLFDCSGKNSKSRTFRTKLHFSTFRAVFSLFDCSGKNSKSRTFRKKLHFSTFRAVFSLFDCSGKNSKSRTFCKKLHFSMSIYSPKYRIWDMSCTRQYLSIRPVSAPSAADIGYWNIGYCPASVSMYPPFQPEIWNMGYAPYASVSTYIGYGILPHVRVYLYPSPTPKY